MQDVCESIPDELSSDCVYHENYIHTYFSLTLAKFWEESVKQKKPLAYQTKM